MQLIRETNLYDDEAVARGIASVDKKVSATYGTCATAADTVAKAVTLEDFVLFKGAQISVYFTYANTASAPTLNVNGTGAAAIWARGAAITSVYYWAARSTHHFTYDGTHWVLENAESQEEAFKRLTNGETQGIYLDNGRLYVNASYIKTGNLLADLITTGKIQSADGKVYFDLDNSELRCDRLISKSNNFYAAALVAEIKYESNNNAGLVVYPTNNTKGYIWFRPSMTNATTLGADRYSEIRSTGDEGLTIINNNSVSIGVYGGVSNPVVTMGAGGGGAVKVFKNLQSSTHYVEISGATNIGGRLYASELSVSGYKNRIIRTKDYGDRLMYSYETPSPLFGDVGEGVISEDGKCYVWIDDIFAETVTLNQYQVFLQKYGEGDCWVSGKTQAYFIVEGTPGLSFGWELKAKQSDFDQYRLEKEEGLYSTENAYDYGDELIKHIAEIKSEREVIAA